MPNELIASSVRTVWLATFGLLIMVTVAVAAAEAFQQTRCHVPQVRIRSRSFLSKRMLVLTVLTLICIRPSGSFQQQRQQPIPQRSKRHGRQARRPNESNRQFQYVSTFKVRSLSSSPCKAITVVSSTKPIDFVVEKETTPITNFNDVNEMNVASLKYLRWSTTTTTTTDEIQPQLQHKNMNRMELQTRVTTFQRYRNVKNRTNHETIEQQPHLETIQLHGQFHFADEKEYYRYYTNDPNFIDSIDTVFYELLVDESLLQYEKNDINQSEMTISTSDYLPIRHACQRKLVPTAVLQASPSDEIVAQQYHWYCQVNCMEYNSHQRNGNNNHWYHADFTRQEFVSQLQQQNSLVASINNNNRNSDPVDRRPLWQQASQGKNSNNGAIVLDATTALLVGPPLIVQQQYPTTSVTTTGLCSLSLSSFVSMASIRRRIFTNLFLPGDGFAVWLRCILWITIPSPELSILLIDWSTTWGSILTSQNRGPTSSLSSTSNKVSPIALPLLQALSQGRFNDVRRLVFGQVALTGHHQAAMSAITSNRIKNTDRDNENSLLVTKRNDHALQLVFTEFDARYYNNSSSNGRSGNCSVALLYGCNHCPDLHVKLMQAGFHPLESYWRTAWSVSVATPETLTATLRINSASEKSSTVGFLVLFLLPLYFLIGGYDWMETIVDVVSAFEHKDDIGTALTILLFYVARHVLLYLSLSKLVLDSDNDN